MTISLTVMMYHYVRNPGDAAERGTGIPGLPVARFQAQIDKLARTYEMLTWDDVTRAIETGESLPPNSCLLTFDDGVCDHYLNVYPILKERGISGLFFALAREPGDGLALGHKLHYLLAKLGLAQLRQQIWQQLDADQQKRFKQAETSYLSRGWSELDLVKGVVQRDFEAELGPILSGLIEKYIGSESELAGALYLSDVQVQEMRAGGMHFGGHSRTHPWFDYISVDQCAQEIQSSRRWLSQFEKPPFAFAYPYGGTRSEAPGLLRGEQFNAAFTTRARTENESPFFIGRFDGEDWDG